MVLAFYFYKRFFKYFFLINTSLTLLFSLIEFFEKIVRAKNATIDIILHFIVLNALPSFFDSIPLSTWLATCFILKELVQQNEWEVFQILNINYNKLFNLFLGAGVALMLFSFIGKEKIILPLQHEAETFKQEYLKQAPQEKIMDKWFVLPHPTSTNNIFCYFNLLDLKNNEGSGLLLIYITSSFEIEKTINIPRFKINPEKKLLYFSNGTLATTESHMQEEIKNKCIILPAFFTQLQLNIKTPSLYLIIKNLISSKKILPPEIWNMLLAQFFKRIFFHLQMLIYPLLTFLFFLLFPFHKWYKWGLILLPYPLITIVNALSDLINQAWFIPIPYLILLLFIFLCKKKLEKSW